MSEETKQDQEFRCSRWLQFLDEAIGNQAGIDCLQEFFGYCLTRDVIFAKALVLVGPARCGKSLILDVLRETLKPAPVTNLTVEEMGNQGFRRFLQPSVLNVSTEDDLRVALDSAYFKSLLAGDMINASHPPGVFPNYRTFTFQPFCKLAIKTNHFPPELLRSQAMMRRLLLVVFRNAPHKSSRIRGLFDLFKQEMKGIRLWAEAGLARLVNRGAFTEPCLIHDNELDALEQGGVALCCKNTVESPMKKLDRFIRENGWSYDFAVTASRALLLEEKCRRLGG
ncbi:phage/plasmid-associated DNA primase [Desulfosalsimonas propionicica]|uniref:Phage/plasmid-associated DNA primase n=1 Tax=Desulfosalsimonas propionicica TaxID=332175 RepID=A0A7W0C9T0_9BACT|nr:hypothetical protein [Desulfosalsimonas propionicica]MBA2881806.1 phage/plasmid-associated DNA primase [Desulfosalsimonas propionicica]